MPNGVEVTDLLCKFSRVEEVDDEHRKSFLAPRTGLDTDSACRAEIEGWEQ